MSKSLTRGVAAALILSGTSITAAAQAGGAGSRARDTIIVRQLTPVAVRIDSVMALFSALQREPLGSNGWVMLRARIDSLLPGMSIISRTRMAPPLEAIPRGWIGINTGGAPRSESLSNGGDVIRYMVHPAVISVDPESPAYRAGIIRGDVLLAYNGIDVVDHDVNVTQLFVPEKRMVVTVRRDGEVKEFTVQVAKTPEHVMQRQLDFDALVPAMMPSLAPGRDIRGDPNDQRPIARITVVPGVAAGAIGEGGPARPRMFMMFAPDGIFGARLSPVTPELARALKLETGVLVNDVPDDSPAAKSGLHAGDVIVGAEGQSIVTLGELQRVVMARLSSRTVDFQVVRDKKQRTITVKW